jgi:cellulose synthase (UDP-forming)
LPHLILSSVTNSRIQGEYRHSFWNDIYETVLSPYILLPTLLALINPRLGKFNVTAKGGVIKRTFFDARIAQPFLVLLVLNIAGLLAAIPRFFVWDRDTRGTVLMNVLWCGFNIVILGVCTAVARELRQLRTTARIKVVTPLVVKFPDGRSVAAETIDVSSGGTGIRLQKSLEVLPQSQVHLAFANPSVAIDLPATVVSSEASVLRVCFENLTIEEQEMLTIALFSRADSWLGLGGSRQNDNVLRSLGRIFKISLRGMWVTFGGIFGDHDLSARKSTSLTFIRASILLFLATALAWAPSAIIAGIKSPYEIAGIRSIVAMQLKNGAASARFIYKFVEVQQALFISNLVAVFHGSQFAPFRIGSAVNEVGVLPWWTHLMLWFTQVPWLAAVLVILLAFLLAIWTRQWLRARARARLTMMGN